MSRIRSSRCCRRSRILRRSCVLLLLFLSGLCFLYDLAVLGYGSLFLGSAGDVDVNFLGGFNCGTFGTLLKNNVCILLCYDVNRCGSSDLGVSCLGYDRDIGGLVTCYDEVCLLLDRDVCLCILSNCDRDLGCLLVADDVAYITVAGYLYDDISSGNADLLSFDSLRNRKLHAVALNVE